MLQIFNSIPGATTGKRASAISRCSFFIPLESVYKWFNYRAPCNGGTTKNATLYLSDCCVFLLGIEPTLSYLLIPF